MEYSFQRDDLDRPVATLNMEAEAFAHWLNIELAGSAAIADIAKLHCGIDQVRSGQCWQYEWPATEFHLTVSRTEVEVSANLLLQHSAFDDAQAEDDGFDDEELPEGATSAGLAASSGLEDFIQLLDAWSDFLQQANNQRSRGLY